MLYIFYLEAVKKYAYPIHSLKTVMKSKLLKQNFLLTSLIIIVFLASCTKTYRCKVCPGNKSPIADAGKDTIIKLPGNSLILDGSSSYDPDGSIVSYRWSKRGGPASYHLAPLQSVKPEATNLVEGEYLFELEVKDNTGQPARDLVEVRVLR